MLKVKGQRGLGNQQPPIPPNPLRKALSDPQKSLWAPGGKSDCPSRFTGLALEGCQLIEEQRVTPSVVLR